MSEARHLAAQLVAFVGSDDQPWFPSLKRALSGVDHRIAAMPIADGNSIWAVVNHIAVWFELTERRVRGDPATDEEARESGWSLPAAGEQAEWERVRDEVARRANALAGAIAGLSDEDLLRPWAPGRAPQWQRLHGAVDHMSFHIGEILTIRAALGRPLPERPGSGSGSRQGQP